MLDDKVMDLLGKILENQTETNSQLKELTPRVKKIESKVENDLGYKIILQMETAHVRKVQ